MNKLEILAPAGSMESLIAGIRCGANAVYLGGKAFSARQNAGNFDKEDLKEAAAYCHVRGAKVYLTVNTLLNDKELEPAMFAVQDGLDAGIDALIIQDLGLASLVHSYFPQAELHASTQMSVTSPAGFRQLEKLGFARAVLPREMSREEMVQIRQSTTMELEAFVHGALCMCVSGQCYLSAMLGSRSGNRGLCAQPCRLPFFVDEPGRCGLSLKDMSLVKQLGELADAGVTSFKIEGRMKRPEYVAAAVTACMQALDDCLQQETLADLQSVFSRSGFTDGYFTGIRGKALFGVRQKEDVVSAKPVLGRLAGLYRNETPQTAVALYIRIHPEEKAVLTVEANGKKVQVESETIPQAAQSRPMTVETLSARLSKCGGTPFYVQSFRAELEGRLILPAAELNGMRRKALEQLSLRLAERKQELVLHQSFLQEDKMPARKKNGVFRWRGVFDSYAQIPVQAKELWQVFLPLEETAAHFQTAAEQFRQVGVTLPRGIFGQEEQVTEKLRQLKTAGVQDLLAGSLGGAALALELGFTVHGDFGLNIWNSPALAVLEQMGIASQTLSLELHSGQLKAIRTHIPTGIVMYGRLPLMLTRNCPVKNEKSCSACGRDSGLTDRKGIFFPVRCAGECAELLNSRPIYLADRRKDVPTDFGTLLFTTETRENVQEIIMECLHAAAPQGEYTRGLLYRGVE